MRFLGAELPYSVTVEIERFVTNERGGYDINGLILVEREGRRRWSLVTKGPKSKPSVFQRPVKTCGICLEAPVHPLNFG